MQLNGKRQAGVTTKPRLRKGICPRSLLPDLPYTVASFPTFCTLYNARGRSFVSLPFESHAIGPPMHFLFLLLSPDRLENDPVRATYEAMEKLAPFWCSSPRFVAKSVFGFAHVLLRPSSRVGVTRVHTVADGLFLGLFIRDEALSLL